MHHLAPLPLILGAIAVLAGLLWLAAAGSDEDGGADSGLLFIFGLWYIVLRVMRQLVHDPMSVLPAFGLIFGGAALIGLGLLML